VPAGLADALGTAAPDPAVRLDGSTGGSAEHPDNSTAPAALPASTARHTRIPPPPPIRQSVRIKM
jgi:hypothetical protein